MTKFTIHKLETAPEASRPILEGATKAFGFLPNLHAILAEAPAALEGYGALWAIFEKTSFTPAERQVVYLSANFENECRYCMAGHSVLGKMAGLPDAAIAALRAGTAIADTKLEALHAFTTAVVRKRGNADTADVNAFLAAGYGRQQILEVILGVAVKTISNYSNHIADTPLDGFMKDTVWTPPSERKSA